MARTHPGTSRTGATTKNSHAHDAVKLLMADHREVKALFARYKKLVTAQGSATERQTLAETICDMLTVHASIEEEIFYPAARAAMPDDALLDEAEVEHASAKDLIAQIKAMSPEDKLYDAKVTVLREYIDHHVQEEEGELFPKATKAGLDLDEIGAELRARKEELTAEQAEGTTQSGTGAGAGSGKMAGH